MVWYKEQLPGYLLGKHQLTATVVFASFFALVFLLANVPFSQRIWFSLYSGKLFGLTVLVFITETFFIIASKVLLHSRRVNADFTVGRYVLWHLLEICGIALIYTCVTRWACSYGIIETAYEGFWSTLLNALVTSVIAYGVPYVIAALYFMVLEKDNTIRLMNYAKVVSDSLPKAHEEKRITLFDNNGTLKLSVDSDNLFFIESDDNYIKVWYMDNGGTLRQYMMRCRMKTIEESFADSDLVRCHRKYIVNIRKGQIIKAGSEGYKLDLGIEGADLIPVSKTYEQSVIARFNSR